MEIYSAKALLYCGPNVRAAIVFDITDRGLLVRNSGQFTYCGDLDSRPCGSIATDGYGCQYHRIADGQQRRKTFASVRLRPKRRISRR